MSLLRIQILATTGLYVSTVFFHHFVSHFNLVPLPLSPHSKYLTVSLALRCQPVLSALVQGESDLAMARINELLPMHASPSASSNEALAHLVAEAMHQRRSQLLQLILRSE